MSEPIESIHGASNQRSAYLKYQERLAEWEIVDVNQEVLLPEEAAMVASGAWAHSDQHKVSRVANEAMENFLGLELQASLPMVGLMDPVHSTEEGRRLNTLNLTLLKIVADSLPPVAEEKGKTFAHKVSENIRAGLKTDAERREEVEKSIKTKERRQPANETLTETNLSANRGRLERMRQRVMPDGSVSVEPWDITVTHISKRLA